MESGDTLALFDRHATADAPEDGTLTLSFDERQRARLRARSDDGEPVALMLERGHILRDGARLTGPSGRVLLVRAAPESVSEVRADGAIALARAAYHLGNRHVALQVGDGWLRYLHDHVLDAMVEGLGLDLAHRQAPFEPEAGAYAGHQHGHGDSTGVHRHD